MQALKEFEFAMEFKHAYLIQQNYALVKDGDILISDMFLPFRSSIGFIEGVNLFVSPAGKAHGWMLETISALYDIQSHNYYSDLVMAHKHNVPGIHSTSHAFTALESHGNAGSSFALLLRRMRHRNP